MPQVYSTRQLLREQTGSYMAVAFMGVFVNLFMLTGAIFMLQIYDRVLPANSVEALVTLFILVVVFYAVFGLLDMARNRVLGRIAIRMHDRLRSQLFGLVMDRALLTGGSSTAGEPIRELNIFTSFLGGPGVTAFFDAPMMLIYIGIIYLLHPWLAALAVGAAVVLFVLAVVNDWITRHAQEEAIQSANKASALLQSIIRFIEPARAMAMIHGLQQRWMKLDDTSIARQDVSSGRIAGMASLSRALRMLMQSAMLALGAWLVIRGEITAGVMVVASIILGRALQPVEMSIAHWRQYQRYRVARQRLDQMLRHRPSLMTEDRHAPESDPKGDLKLVEVHAVPPNAKKAVLQNVSFHLPPGRLLLVVGPNGSGKSVLARLCAGIWRPARGKVLLDNADLAIWPPETLGRLVGYMPQNVQLLEGTIGENIARFDADPDEKALHEAVREAHVADAIKAMGGFDRQVGTDGNTLSLGERKRVALARALYGHPVLIVLDEPFAGLDSEGRNRFLEAIADMKKRGQTVVLVEHIPVLSEQGRAPMPWEKTVLDLADSVLVLRNGRVADFRTRKKPEASNVGQKS